MSEEGGVVDESKGTITKVLHYLGPPGTYSHQVALEMLPRLKVSEPGKILLQACDTIKATTEEACKRTQETNQTSWSLLPYENNSNGPVKDSYDVLFALGPTMRTKIIAEYHLPVNHSLMCTKQVYEKVRGTGGGPMDLGRLDVVSSHSQVSKHDAISVVATSNKHALSF